MAYVAMAQAGIDYAIMGYIVMAHVVMAYAYLHSHGRGLPQAFAEQRPDAPERGSKSDAANVDGHVDTGGAEVLWASVW